MRSTSMSRKFYSYNPRRLKASLVLGFLFFYFAFHLVTGPRGLLAYAKLSSEIATKTEQHERIQQQKLELATRVGGMRDEALDLDLLEEVARKDLGYSKRDEVVMFDE